MGRTILPARYEVEAQLDELRRFVKSLRKEDRQYFENLYVDIKNHISSITYAHPLNPNNLMLWSAMIELEKKIQVLKDEIDRYIQD